MVFWNSQKSLKKLEKQDLNTRLSTKNILIVGGTSGIGRALAIACLNNGSKVTIVGRRTPDESLKNATFVKKDLSSMQSAQELAKEIDTKKFDIIVFSNGIIASKTKQLTAEGLEMDLAVSFLSRYAFIKEVLSSGKFAVNRQDKSCKARIFVLGYPGKSVTADMNDLNSEKEYKPWATHSKF